MKKIFYFLIVIGFNLIACNYDTQVKNIQANKVLTEINSNITLFLFPSGCENENCYSYKIEITKNRLIVNGNYYMRYDDGKKRKILSAEEIAKLNELAQAIDSPYINEESAEDVWSAKIIINKKLVYKEGEFSFETTPQKIKYLIDYIVGLSPLEIELYHFA